MHFTFALGIVILAVWILPMVVNLTPMGKSPVFMFSGTPLKILRIIVSVVTGALLFVNFFDTNVPVVVQIISSALMVISLAMWTAVWALCLGEESYLPMENNIGTMVYVCAVPVSMISGAFHSGNWILLVLAVSLLTVRWLCARPYLIMIKSEEPLKAE